MRIQVKFICAAKVLFFVGIACAAGVPALAGGNGKDAKDAPAYRLAPTLEKKVFTNEDLEMLVRHHGGPDTVPAPPASTSFAGAQSAPSQTVRTLMPPEKDPQWYAQQAGSLSAQAEAINTRVQQLQQFRSTGTAAGAVFGLAVDAPCEGITTDNEIQQLILQRTQIESRIEELEDAARQNNIPPGVFRTSAASGESAEITTLTPADTESSLIERFQKLDEEIAQFQVVVESMKNEAAARHMTLIPESAFGGSPTADLLQRLSTQERALREEASAVVDDARQSGVPTGQLP
jgi:hypothetical protein